MSKPIWALLTFGLASSLLQAQPSGKPLPVIDMHLDAASMQALGGHVVNCGSPIQEWAPRDGREKFGVNDVRSRCDMPLVSPATDAEFQSEVLKNLEELNITAVLSGPLDRVLAWRARAQNSSRIIPSIRMNLPGNPPLEELRAAFTTGKAAVLGEVLSQGYGISADHVSMEPYFAMCEELDIPIAMHMALAAPAAAYIENESYLIALSNPLLIEPVLRRHPRLRIYLTNAAWPMLDELVAMMYSHPQLYVDTGVIDWAIPRKEFDGYIKRLVEAGFGNRIMYGSDEFMWPQAMKISIEWIETANYLTAAQKRDILYNNAARFLRLDKAVQH